MLYTNYYWLIRIDWLKGAWVFSFTAGTLFHVCVGVIVCTCAARSYSEDFIQILQFHTSLTCLHVVLIYRFQQRISDKFCNTKRILLQWLIQQWFLLRCVQPGLSLYWVFTGRKSHYPPGNHHASYVQKCPISRSYHLLTTSTDDPSLAGALVIKWRIFSTGT